MGLYAILMFNYMLNRNDRVYIAHRYMAFSQENLKESEKLL